jgi:hypothetical protein
MRKLKTHAKHALYQAHKHSDKTRTVLEAVANIIIALETRLLFLSALLIVWSIVDVLNILEIKNREVKSR